MFFNVKKAAAKQVRDAKINENINELSREDVLRVAGGGCEVVGQNCHLDGKTVRCESYSVVCK